MAACCWTMSILLFVLYLLTAIKKRDAAFIFFGLAESFVVLLMTAFYAALTGTDAPFLWKALYWIFLCLSVPVNEALVDWIVNGSKNRDPTKNSRCAAIILYCSDKLYQSGNQQRLKKSCMFFISDA